MGWVIGVLTYLLIVCIFLDLWRFRKINCEVRK